MQYIETLLLLCWLSFCANATVLPDTVKTGQEYLTLAQQQEAQNNPNQAIEYYELAKGDFEQKKDNSNLAYVLTKLAHLYTSDTTTHIQAEAYLDSALQILHQHLSNNDTLTSLTWSAKADLALAQREFYQAIEYYQNSLERKRDFYGEEHSEVAHELEEIGNVYLYNLQNPYESERFHQQVLDIREKLNDQGRLLINCYYHLSFANRLRGDLDKALAYAVKVQEGYSGLPEVSPFSLVIANSLLSTVYFDLDSINEALDYNKQAIEIGKQVSGINLSAHHNNQARYFFKNQAYDSSLYYIQLAMEGQTNAELLATSYQFLGNVYREQEKLELAFTNYRKSRSLKEAIFSNYHPQLATLYTELGQAFETSQQIDSALFYYKLGLENARVSQKTDTDSTLIRLEDDFATIEVSLIKIINTLVKQYGQTQDTNHLKSVLPYFKMFDQFMDLSRSDFSTEGAKLILSGNNKSVYEKAIAGCYQLFQIDQSDSLLRLAFHFMEKSKAVVLLESIRATNRNQQFLPDSITQQYQSLQAQLAYCQARLAEIEQQPDSVSNIVEWQQKSAKILRELEVMDDYVQHNYPNYYAITNNGFTVSLDTLQKGLNKHEAVISYFWGDSAVYAMLIAEDRIALHQAKNIDQLQISIGQYQDVLANDNISDPSYTNFLRFQESALSLYQSLLAPFNLDTTIQHLTIVSDGELATIPFESLITSTVETTPNDIRYEDLPYLIHHYNFAYELSSSVAFWNKQRISEAEYDNLDVVAFGIKNFEYLSKQHQYPSLGGAEDEVQYVKEKFPQAQLFLNEKATEKAFKQYASEANLLHIATHGMADQENPFNSRFIFYPNQQEDGTLFLHELYDMSLQAQLLILSACESGVGKYYAGEGSFSLARSFIYAGCQSVIMSLWEINDRLTTQMVTAIYSQLAEQVVTNEALQKAKIGFIRQGRLAHPKCWAGMVLLGNTQTKFVPANYNSYTVAFIAGSAVLILIYLARLLLRRQKLNELFIKLGARWQKA